VRPEACGLGELESVPSQIVAVEQETKPFLEFLEIDLLHLSLGGDLDRHQIRLLPYSQFSPLEGAGREREGPDLPSSWQSRPPPASGPSAAAGTRRSGSGGPSRTSTATPPTPPSAGPRRTTLCC